MSSQTSDVSITPWKMIRCHHKLHNVYCQGFRYIGEKWLPNDPANDWLGPSKNRAFWRFWSDSNLKYLWAVACDLCRQICDAKLRQINSTVDFQLVSSNHVTWEFISGCQTQQHIYCCKIPIIYYSHLAQPCAVRSEKATSSRGAGRLGLAGRDGRGEEGGAARLKKQG